jgi:hypothetical protein
MVARWNSAPPASGRSRAAAVQSSRACASARKSVRCASSEIGSSAEGGPTTRGTDRARPEPAKRADRLCLRCKARRFLFASRAASSSAARRAASSSASRAASASAAKRAPLPLRQARGLFPPPDAPLLLRPSGRLLPPPQGAPLPLLPPRAASSSAATRAASSSAAARRFFLGRKARRLFLGQPRRLFLRCKARRFLFGQPGRLFLRRKARRFLFGKPGNLSGITVRPIRIRKARLLGLTLADGERQRGDRFLCWRARSRPPRSGVQVRGGGIAGFIRGLGGIPGRRGRRRGPWPPAQQRLQRRRRPRSIRPSTARRRPGKAAPQQHGDHERRRKPIRNTANSFERSWN